MVINRDCNKMHGQQNIKFENLLFSLLFFSASEAWFMPDGINYTAAVVGRCVVGCEHSSLPTTQRHTTAANHI